MSRRFPAETVVVYQRYLSLLANIQQDMAGATTPDPYKQVNPFTRKFCRYCDAYSGKWSDLDSCVLLNCDPSVLTGSPELVLVNNQTALNTTKYPNILFKPFSVLAVYSFGSEKSMSINLKIV